MLETCTIRLFVFVLIFSVSGLDALAQPIRGFWQLNFVQNLIVQPDGKLLVAGNIRRGCLGRLLVDGDIDSGFRAFQTAVATETDNFLRPEASVTGAGCAEYALQADGKIIGATNRGSSYSSSVFRLNQDGSIDSTITSPLFADFVHHNVVEFHAITVAPEGKIYVGGKFETVDGMVRPGLIRLNPNGTVDSTFGPVYIHAPGGYPGHVTDVDVLPDGRLIVAGYFDAIGGTWRSAIARLNPNGTADNSFIDLGLQITPGLPSMTFARIFRQHDGKLLLNGNITPGPQGTFGSGLVRLNADGSLDSLFRPPSGQYLCVDDLLTPGKLFCSLKHDYNGLLTEQPAAIRLNSIDGSIDQSYAAPHITGGATDIAIQADGKLIVAGPFTLTQAPKMQSLIRLNRDGTLDAPKITQFDYDGDQIADISVFRPSNGKWYVLGSQAGFKTMNWGAAGDKIAPADFDGDGITDIAVFRPSNGTWYVFNSATNTFTVNQYGLSDDIPMPGRFDLDRKADLMLFRPSSGKWYLKGSVNTLPSVTPFGEAGDIPLSGDFDGDLFSDMAVYRPSDKQWKISFSTSRYYNPQIRQWGEPTDKFVPADYDGDGHTDIAVYRPSTGEWWIIPSSAPTTFNRLTWGIPGDVPVAADYDGDGKADRAIFRSSNNSWYIAGSSTGIRVIPFGASGDIPTESVLP